MINKAIQSILLSICAIFISSLAFASDVVLPVTAIEDLQGPSLKADTNMSFDKNKIETTFEYSIIRLGQERKSFVLRKVLMPSSALKRKILGFSLLPKTYALSKVNLDEISLKNKNLAKVLLLNYYTYDKGATLSSIIDDEKQIKYNLKARDIHKSKKVFIYA